MSKYDEKIYDDVKEVSVYKPVSNVRLHAATAINGIFGTENTINTTRVPGIKMYTDGSNVYFEKNGKKASIHVSGCMFVEYA